MEEQQFRVLKSTLGSIEDNTSWTWHVNNELEALNKKLKSIEDLLEENNELMQQLIETVQNNR